MSLISNWLAVTNTRTWSLQNITHSTTQNAQPSPIETQQTHTQGALFVSVRVVPLCAMVSWFGRGVEDGFETGPLCLWILSFFLTCDDFPEKMKSERESARKWRKWDGWCSLEEFCSGSTFYCQLLVAFSCFLLGIFGCIHDFVCASPAFQRLLMVHLFSLYISLFSFHQLLYSILHTHTHTQRTHICHGFKFLIEFWTFILEKRKILGLISWCERV